MVRADQDGTPGLTAEAQLIHVAIGLIHICGPA